MNAKSLRWASKENFCPIGRLAPSRHISQKKLKILRSLDNPHPVNPTRNQSWIQFTYLIPVPSQIFSVRSTLNYNPIPMPGATTFINCLLLVNLILWHENWFLQLINTSFNNNPSMEPPSSTIMFFISLLISFIAVFYYCMVLYVLKTWLANKIQALSRKSNFLLG